MKVKSAAALAPLLLAACSPSEEQGNVSGVEKAAKAQQHQPEQRAEVPSLEGSWQVTQINGQEPNQVWPMTAEVADNRFELRSECRVFNWGVVQDRNTVKFTPAGIHECARARSPAELVVEQPVDQANIVMFSDDGNQVEISGPGGLLTMVRR